MSDATIDEIWLVALAERIQSAGAVP